jgi:hypothetical protein
MERSDERLSTRDLASGTGAADSEAERDTALAGPADAPPADSGAVRADRVADDDFADTTGTAGSDRPASRESISDPADQPTGGPAAQDAAYDRDTTTADSGGADTAASADASAGDQAGAGALVEGSDDFQRRWEQIQGRFVDEPRGAVEDADALVATVMQRLAEGFAVERERLEAQWGRGEDISTEDLRVSLQRYRSFFQRLLST